MIKYLKVEYTKHQFINKPYMRFLIYGKMIPLWATINKKINYIPDPFLTAHYGSWMAPSQVKEKITPKNKVWLILNNSVNYKKVCKKIKINSIISYEE